MLGKVIFMRHLGFVVWAALAAACASEQDDWDKARAEDSVAAYRQFLEQHPDGERVADARAALEHRIDERDWAAAQRVHSIAAYEGYVARPIGGAHVESARKALILLRRAEAWAAARETGRIEAYEEFAKANPDTVEEKEARRLLTGMYDRRDWGAAKQTRSVAGYENYLGAYPDGEHAQAAREAIATLRDEAAWGRARDANSIPAYEEYLAEFTEGAHAGSARERIAALPDEDWKAAREADTVPAYERYLAAHPKAEHSTAARARRDELGRQVRLLLERAEAEWKKKKYPKAIATADRVLRLDPSEVEGHAMKADSYIQLRDWENALAHYEAADRLDPNEPRYLGNKASCLLSLERLEQMEACLREGHARFPNEAVLYVVEGSALIQVGEATRALRAFRIAARMGKRSRHLLWAYRLGKLSGGEGAPPLNWSPALKRYLTNVGLVTHPRNLITIGESELDKRPPATGKGLRPAMGLGGARYGFGGSAEKPLTYLPNFEVWQGAVLLDPQYGHLLQNGTRYRQKRLVGGKLVIQTGVIWKGRTKVLETAPSPGVALPRKEAERPEPVEPAPAPPGKPEPPAEPSDAGSVTAAEEQADRKPGPPAKPSDAGPALAAEEQADQMLTRLDRNKNGTIESGEWPPLLGAGISTRYDLDGDGAVTRVELVGFYRDPWRRWSKSARRAAATSALNRFDRNKDGKLTVKEVRFLKREDSDGDGVISFEELMPDNPLWKMDKNGDRKVSRDEFRDTRTAFEWWDRNKDGVIDALDDPG
ncbi:MAG: hypothetical protein ACYSX0_12340 [Planctomycetota bacterium]|jgi:tetratricopeptide (TPR) repeat protein/Ca2+-binding EF-hand superfamily protein